MWEVSRSAVLLLFLTTILGVVGGGIVGCWILPVVIAFAHGGLQEVLSLQISEKVFADPPHFLIPGSRVFVVVDWARLILGILGIGLGVTIAQRIWRYFAVHRCHWLTSKQADEFLKRDPGW
jgi:NhaP-type Na+/H+ or K+/H+ antiporter